MTSCYDIPGIPYYKLDVIDNGLAQGSNSLHIITISSDVSFDAIYYTLDNSSPSSSSQWYSPSTYTGADLNTYYGIVISEGTTIKAIGYRYKEYNEENSFIAEKIIPSCSHKWGDGEITTKPTCIAKGEKTYTCTSCGLIKKVTLAITDHAWNSGDIITAPTCTTSGIKAYTCTVCDETKTETINATGHSWNSGVVTTEPGCTTTGVRTYTCTKCNGTKTETINATEHSWNSGVVTTEPRCATTGVKTYTCTKCNGTKTETINATGHSWNSGVVTTEPGCTTAGVRTYTCTKCNGTKTETINATEHSWNSGVVTTEPRCATTGVKTYTCTKCNGTKTETINATGHSWNSGVVTTEPGCTTAGVRTYTCTKCNGTKTETINATEHSWNSGVVTTEPRCATTGVKTYTCTKCNGTRTEAIEATGEHSYVNYKCSVCSHWGKGPSGGYVFYDKGSYSDGWRYLEAAPTDLSSTYPFGFYRTSSSGSNTTVGTKYAIGTGKSNTEALVKAMGETTYTSDSGTTKVIYAAKACYDYSITVNDVLYDDWFLPSKSELDLMYTNLYKNGEGSFADSIFYWSSSEHSDDYAWNQNFSNGNQYYRPRYNSYRVRPIRAF